MVITIEVIKRGVVGFGRVSMWKNAWNLGKQKNIIISK